MRTYWCLAFILIMAGACARQWYPTTSTTPVSVRSVNRSDVDVYLLCGDRNALPLGTVKPGADTVLEVPTARLQCAVGLNFFVVVRAHNHGYWVGPLRPDRGTHIRLLIDRYAALSTVRARR